jgi:hypothetical protein
MRKKGPKTREGMIRKEFFGDGRRTKRTEICTESRKRKKKRVR